MGQNQKLQKPNYRTMLAVLVQCARKNMSKAVFAILLYTILQSVIFSISMVPLLASSVGGGVATAGQTFQLPSTPMLAFTLILCFVATVICIMLNYGLFVIMARMVEKKYVTIGYLFSGFKNKKVRKAAILFAILFSIATIICAVVMALCEFKTQTPTDMDQTKLMSAISVVFIVFMGIMVLLLLPFTFVWMILYTDKNITSFKSFVISARLMFGHVFHFIGFLLAAGGMNLVIAVAASVGMFFIPSDAAGALQVLSVVLSMVTFVTEYVAMVRMYLAVPIYFFSLTGVMHVYTGNESTAEATPSLPDQQGKIEGPDSTTQDDFTKQDDNETSDNKATLNGDNLTDGDGQSDEDSAKK